ncbi:MAG: OmpA family protein [Leptospiraceae bacterium]|nr:OmpA family protein [Leptospiraceae bacterium]
MKNFIVSTLAASALLVTVACGGGSSSNTRGGSIDTGSGMVGALNRALQEVSYSPGGKGFGYKSVTVPASELNKWAKDNKDTIESTLSKLPAGYVLQITGHTDSVGPRTAPGDGRRGNVWYSEQRAKAVYNALRAQGMPADKLSFKGVADDLTTSVCGSDEQCQRRVTLQVVEK